ncbi:hypothetical protein [Flagellimonas pacifica]|uniref:Uncharacterized protein n=1 Tax=Flagellimonas pacifica TaxID=1247520 RepID=A0A285MT25_9FLAO|nr:hypothetical protein [Allomuricauda parva]SNZ00359.1 hypothetical protein SAMN06265377_2181 [Allomuricauda parva]
MTKEGKSKKGTIIGIIAGIISFVLAYYGVQQLFKTDFASELEKTALELNKQTPMQIDQFTRLDSASTKGKTNFIYHYTLVKIEKSEVNLDTVNKYIKSDIVDNVKNNPDLKIFRDNEITLDYKYYDKNGELSIEISVTPELYKQ